MIELNLKNFINSISLDKSIRALVACSGGLDSSVLLAALNKIKINNFKVVGVVHINHNLRVDSKLDQEFVRQQAEKYSLKFYCLDICPLRLDITNESWGRDVRYAFFKECIDKTNATSVFTAHHSDDQIETFLFKLITGRNNQNLTLIKEIDEERKLIRPLLSFSKNELLEYALINKISFVTDSTNTDTKYVRNFIRHEILPRFEQVNPEYSKAIFNFIDSVSSDLSFVDSLAKVKINYNLNSLLAESESVGLRMLIHKAQLSLGEVTQKISLRRFKELLKFIRTLPTSEIHFDLGCDILALVDLRSKENELEFITSSELVERKKRLAQHELFDQKLELGIPLLSFCPISGNKIKFIFEPYESGSVRNGEVFGLDPQDFPLSVSGRSKSEFIEIEGVGGKRISRLLKERKVSLREKKSLFYISQENECIWIPNVARRSKLKCQGKTQFSISVLPMEE